MKFPTKYDHFGYNWLDQISQGFHPGVDYNFGQSRDDEGQDIYSIAIGEVVYAGSDKGWGWHIIIKHPELNIWSHYAHLQSICVNKSDKICEGQIIGFLGGTGGDWAPHLHFEIRLQDFSPNAYVTGKNLDDIKRLYASPDEWLKNHGAEFFKPDLNIPINEIKQNNVLAERLKGRILLQVESHGEAWYVDPTSGKRYYLKNGEEALKIMSKLGFGISNADLEKIPAGELNV